VLKFKTKYRRQRVKLPASVRKVHSSWLSWLPISNSRQVHSDFSLPLYRNKNVLNEISGEKCNVNFIPKWRTLFPIIVTFTEIINPLNTELNPIYHFLALLGAHPIHVLHVSRIRVKLNDRKAPELLWKTVYICICQVVCSPNNMQRSDLAAFWTTSSLFCNWILCLSLSVTQTSTHTTTNTHTQTRTNTPIAIRYSPCPSYKILYVCP
jgi:hypothetical protein